MRALGMIFDHSKYDFKEQIMPALHKLKRTLKSENELCHDLLTIDQDDEVKRAFPFRKPFRSQDMSFNVEELCDYIIENQGSAVIIGNVTENIRIEYNIMVRRLGQGKVRIFPTEGEKYIPIHK